MVKVPKTVYIFVLMLHFVWWHCKTVNNIVSIYQVIYFLVLPPRAPNVCPRLTINRLSGYRLLIGITQLVHESIQRKLSRASDSNHKHVIILIDPVNGTRAGQLLDTIPPHLHNRRMWSVKWMACARYQDLVSNFRHNRHNSSNNLFTPAVPLQLITSPFPVLGGWTLKESTIEGEVLSRD